jgi:hypothetical protein
MYLERFIVTSGDLHWLRLKGRNNITLLSLMIKLDSPISTSSQIKMMLSIPIKTTKHGEKHSLTCR